MKKFAYYLPQFHEIPENNEWWGKGFTEWTNVKKALPLFKKHIQPKHPYGDNYYSLENIDTLQWQANLAHKYHIDGMIFYHYYFCGKKLLQKPAELLLEHHDIQMPFFFCWANHSWIKSWEGNKELLIEQTYGDKKDWEKHFQYLIKFFKDDRYFKQDNKPLFMIFRSNFKFKNDYLAYLDQRCKDYGFNGLCGIEIVETYNKRVIEKFRYNCAKCTDYIHIREPGAMTENYMKNVFFIYEGLRNKIGRIMSLIPDSNFKYIRKYNGNIMYSLALLKKISKKKIIRGLCFEWDNSPRHKERGYIITPPTKKLFFRYMNSIKSSPFVFINAWNEWCEGMMLEPTVEFGYKYLEWIQEWSEMNENRANRI